MSRTPQDEARIELLSRLEHFALQPRTLLDLDGAVTDVDDGILRRRFPQARIIVSSSAGNREAGAAGTAVGHGVQAMNVVDQVQQWWRRLRRGAGAP